MLVELDIKNFAIIKEVQVQFDSGMTVLMGETGAGKSILIDALSIILGARASSEMIRTGSDQASVAGLFSIAPNKQTKLADIFEKQGLELDNQILIQRQISRKGRNVIRINGQLATINTLTEIGRLLVDIHGQQDQQILMDEAQHINLLDEFGKKTIEPLKETYVKLYLRWVELTTKKRNLEKNSQEIAQQKDILTFQVEEIRTAKISTTDEDQILENEFNTLSNFQSISDFSSQLLQLLENDENNIVDSVGTGMGLADNLASLSHEFDNLATIFNDTYYALDDARGELNSIIDGLDFDEERFKELNERIILLTNLKKKYGPTLADVLSFYDDKLTELNSLLEFGADTTELAKQIDKLEKEMSKAAKALSKARQEASKKLIDAIHQELQDLYMKKAKFSVKFESTSKFTADGLDFVEFYISTNPGESLKPLVKIASGGEQSRIILALKVIFGKLSPVSTMIFDEIDTGVSGRVATAIGEKMLSLAQQKQVIAITHSPQVAASADERYLIEKQVKDDETYTTLTNLNQDESVEAIAKMIAGNQVTAAAVSNAKELLALHQKK